MKIVIDARYLSADHSGIGVHSELMLKHLSALEQNYEFTVIVHRSFDRRLGLGKNFEIVRADARPVSFRSIYGAIDRILAEVKPDVFHSLFPLVPYRYTGPTIVTVYDLQPFTVGDFTGKRNPILRYGYDVFYRWAYQTAFNRADVLITVSEYTRSAMRQMFPKAAHRTLVVPCGLNDAFFRPITVESKRAVWTKHRIPDRYILYVGSTRPNKNLPRMLQAFADYLLETRDPTLHFFLVVNRDRFWVDAERIIERSIPPGRVRVARQVPQDELRVIYAGAEALFFATKSEGFGFPVLEAQASGVPVIAGADGALIEVAGDGAWMVDPDDPNQLVQALKVVIGDAELRQSLIAAGFENCQKFTWERNARMTLDIYRYMFDPAEYTIVRREDESVYGRGMIGAPQLY